MRSDDCPILVKLLSQVSNFRFNPPFRFQATWMQHNDFGTFVNESWMNSNLELLKKTEFVAAELKLGIQLSLVMFSDKNETSK